MHQIKRRIVLLMPAVAGLSCLHGRAAHAQTVKVDEGEPKATAIGYRHDSAKVDGARYPKHDAAQRCHNCLAFAPDKPADEWGECDLMSDRLVHRDGWCSSYKKKKKA
jgi:hypothetical protein